MRKFIFLVSVFLLVNLSSYTFANEKRFYLCFPLTKNPVLDGKLRDDPAWKNISVETNFVKINTLSLSSKQTSFKMGYNSEALYIGVECEEPEIEKVKSELKDMESLWKEDSIEIFIFPKGAKNYNQFVINTIGSRWNRIDGNRMSKKSLANWQAKTYKGKDYYSIEIRIPFEIFHDAIPKKWEEWTGNICRNIFTSGDKFTSWAYLTDSFHDLVNFGRIIFAGEGTKDKITVNFLRKEIAANLELISALEKDFSEAQEKHPSLQKELTSFLKNYEEIKNGISRFDSLSIKEANLLLKKSDRLIKESDKLKEKILLENFFDEGGLVYVPRAISNVLILPDQQPAPAALSNEIRVTIQHSRVRHLHLSFLAYT